MAPLKNALPIYLLGIFLISTPVLGNIECEELPIEDCAFAVSSTGARCVLEKYVLSNVGEAEYKCQTSIIMAERNLEWIETDECVKSCGLQRISVGLSTDALLERDFTRKLCSPACQENCPNIADLYIKLAAGEGVYLPHLCEVQRPKPRRLIADRLAKTTLPKHAEWVAVAAASPKSSSWPTPSSHEAPIKAKWAPPHPTGERSASTVLLSQGEAPGPESAMPWHHEPWIKAPPPQEVLPPSFPPSYSPEEQPEGPYYYSETPKPDHLYVESPAESPDLAPTLAPYAYIPEAPYALPPGFAAAPAESNMYYNTMTSLE